MRSWLSVFVALCALGCGGASRPEIATEAVGGGGAAHAPETERRLRERLTPLVSELTRAFGSCAAITVAHGSSTVTVVEGTLWEGGPDAQASTPFNVASVSKLLTAAQIVTQAHEGALGLDDTLNTRLPGVELLRANGAPVEGVTVRHLLQHRSGVPHLPPDLEQRIDEGNHQAPDLLYQLTESWPITLASPVGEYSYSNLGYALLGAIVERTAQCSFADCMAARLSALGMTGASFWPANLEGSGARGRVVVDGAPTFHPPSWYASRYHLPFGGLWTSMPDLARFGSRLAVDARDPGSALHRMSVGSGHGLGPIHRTRLGAPSLEHDGSTEGFHAALVVIPDADITVAVATNGGNGTRAEEAAFAAIVSAAVEAVPSP